MNRVVLFGLASTLVALMGTTAHAADLPAAVEPGVVDVGDSGNWDGLYIGGFAGYGVAAFYNDEGEEADVEDFSGWLIGGKIGADFTVTDGIVAGVVADAAWTDIAATVATSDHDVGLVNWQASLRGRIGYDAGAFLPYLTAGLAVANATLWSYQDESASSSATHVGWTAGAGVEFAVSENVSVDLLYRYSRYGEAEYNIPSIGPQTGSFATSTIQAGLNWRF